MSQPTRSSPQSIVAAPLSAEAFAPFGDVLENVGAIRRNFFVDATSPGEEPGELKLWVNHVKPEANPVSVTQLERHPFAAQTFMPLKVSRWLVIVAPSMSDGSPDSKGLKAFLAGAGQGVSYRRGTWHHHTTVLDAVGQFGVLMWRRAAGDDDEFYDLAEPIEVLPPPG